MIDNVIKDFRDKNFHTFFYICLCDHNFTIIENNATVTLTTTHEYKVYQTDC